MKIKNLVEESIKEVSQKINALSIGELSKEKIALIGEYSSLNEKLINIKILIDKIYVEIWGCYSGNNKRFK